MKIFTLTGVLAATMLLACDDEPVGPCPSAPVQPAITVAVTAAATGDTLTASASGFVREGTYSDSLQVCESDAQGRPLVRCAGWGRSGTYELSVSATGYAPWDTSGVSVGRTRCANGTVHLNVRLQLASRQRE